ncbi:MarR family winged helix-turn-helix transcriptional regulator [Oxalobacteraceae bacterium A2-2]
MTEPNQLADQLRLTLQRLVRELRRQESEHESISLIQKLLLVNILEHPGIGVAELARMEKLRGPTISGHIKALEEAGLVARAADTGDRRRIGLHITDLGLEKMRQHRARRQEWLAGKVNRLPPASQALLGQALTILNEIIDE